MRPHSHQRPQLGGAAFGFGAALLFGASAPIAKRILPEIGALPLAALLYLGAGAALSLVMLVTPRGARREAPLRAADAGLLAGVVIAGGIAGPILLLTGLGRVSALAGSLLLNLEAPLTVLVALLLFREHLGGRELGALAFVLAGAAMLGYRPGQLYADPWGIAAIAGACACWALDNNLTQRLSLRDPIAVTRIKTLGAGSCTLILALASGHTLPPPRLAGFALALGAVAYGASIVLHMHALRRLGAARQAAFFATAPFVGAALAVPLLGERPALPDAVAAGLMLAGVLLLLRERHSHEHTHDPVEHEHVHSHDEHHAHAHEHDAAPLEPHSHRHRHAAVKHAHPHASDLHHRHKH